MNRGGLACRSRVAVEGAGWPEETLSPCHRDSEIGEGTDKSHFSTHTFESHSKFSSTSSKFGLYLQDLRPVLQDSKIIPHLQTEGWPCCVLGKPAPRRGLLTSALLSNASLDILQALQRNPHPFPSTDDDGIPVAAAKKNLTLQFRWSQPAAGDKLVKKAKEKRKGVWASI